MLFLAVFLELRCPTKVKGENSPGNVKMTDGTQCPYPSLQDTEQLSEKQDLHREQVNCEM